MESWFTGDCPEATHGHISAWVTTQLTNGFRLFEFWVGTNDGNGEGDGYSYGDVQIQHGDHPGVRPAGCPDYG